MWASRQMKLVSKLYDDSHLKLHFETINIINYLLACYLHRPAIYAGINAGPEMLC